MPLRKFPKWGDYYILITDGVEFETGVVEVPPQNPEHKGETLIVTDQNKQDRTVEGFWHKERRAWLPYPPPEEAK